MQHRIDVFSAFCQLILLLMLRCLPQNHLSPPPSLHTHTPHTNTQQGTAFADTTAEAHAVPHAGNYHFRANPEAEKHLNDPAAIAALQAAVQVRVLCMLCMLCKTVCV